MSGEGIKTDREKTYKRLMQLPIGWCDEIHVLWHGDEWRCGVQSHVAMWSHPMLWNYNKCPSCALSLCRGVVINGW